MNKIEKHNYKHLFHTKYLNHVFIKNEKSNRDWGLNIICENCATEAIYIEPNCYIFDDIYTESLLCEECIIKNIIE